MCVEYVVGSFEWHCFLCPDDWDIRPSRGGPERCSFAREIFAGLLHKHIEEIERPQSTIKANWLFHLESRTYGNICVHEKLYYSPDKDWTHGKTDLDGKCYAFLSKQTTSAKNEKEKLYIYYLNPECEKKRGIYEQWKQTFLIKIKFSFDVVMNAWLLNWIKDRAFVLLV